MAYKSLGEIDVQILRSLQGDARKSFKEISDQINVSTDTIKNHYNSMIRRGIIRGNTIVIDPKQIEKKHIVLIGIQIIHPYSNQVLNMVRKVPGMCVVTRAIGRYDIEAIAILEDIEQIGVIKGMIGDFQQVRNVDIDIFVDKPLLCPKNFEFE